MPESAVILLVTAVVAVPVAVLLVFSLRRQRRDYAALRTGEAAAAFSLPPRVNWQISSAIRGGRAVTDPDLAALAADRADHVLRANELGLVLQR